MEWCRRKNRVKLNTIIIRIGNSKSPKFYAMFFQLFTLSLTLQQREKLHYGLRVYKGIVDIN